MFAKPYKVKSNNSLKNSEKKHLIQRIVDEFPAATEESAKSLVPLKSSCVCMKLVVHSGEAVDVFVVDGVPLVLGARGRLLPTVCALWRLPALLPALTVQAPVLPKIQNGAPLYLPGVCVPAGGAGFPMFARGAPLAAVTSDNAAAAAVGLAALASGDMLLKLGVLPAGGVCCRLGSVLPARGVCCRLGECAAGWGVCCRPGSVLPAGGVCCRLGECAAGWGSVLPAGECAAGRGSVLPAGGVCCQLGECAAGGGSVLPAGGVCCRPGECAAGWGSVLPAGGVCCRPGECAAGWGSVLPAGGVCCRPGECAAGWGSVLPDGECAAGWGSVLPAGGVCCRPGECAAGRGVCCRPGECAAGWGSVLPAGGVCCRPGSVLPAGGVCCRPGSVLPAGECAAGRGVCCRPGECAAGRGSVLPAGGVCCRPGECAAGRGSVLPAGGVCCRMGECAAGRGSVLPAGGVCCRPGECAASWGSVLPAGGVCCRLGECAAGWGSVLPAGECAAGWGSVLPAGGVCCRPGSVLPAGGVCCRPGECAAGRGSELPAGGVCCRLGECAAGWGSVLPAGGVCCRLGECAAGWGSVLPAGGVCCRPGECAAGRGCAAGWGVCCRLGECAAGELPAGVNVLPAGRGPLAIWSPHLLLGNAVLRMLAQIFLYDFVLILQYLDSSGVCLDVLHWVGDQLCRDPKFGKLERPRLPPPAHPALAALAALAARPDPSERLAAEVQQLHIQHGGKEEWPSLGGRAAQPVPQMPQETQVTKVPQVPHAPRVLDDAPAPAQQDDSWMDGAECGTAGASAGGGGGGGAGGAVPTDMDELLQWTLVSFIKQHAKSIELPLRASLLYRNYLLPLCPADRTLDVKKTSYKKVGKFLEAMQKRTCGSQVTVCVNTSLRDGSSGGAAGGARGGEGRGRRGGAERGAPARARPRPARRPRRPAPPAAPAAPADDDVEYTPPQVREMFAVTAAVADLFAPLKKGATLTAAEARAALTQYVQTRGLTSAHQKGAVTLDAVLARVLNGNEQESVRWDALMLGVQARMTPCTEMRFADGSCSLTRARLEPIKMQVVTRSGNKKVPPPPSPTAPAASPAPGSSPSRCRSSPAAGTRRYRPSCSLTRARLEPIKMQVVTRSGNKKREQEGTAPPFADGSCSLTRARLEPIKMQVVTRSGNKKVTLVSNLESFGFALGELARAWQRGAAAAAGVTRAPGARADQILLQGDQTYFVARLLVEKYGLPKKFVEGADKALKKKKGT
ncbi:hypothetical protein MSG28_009428 [Choristoneura fumiferana]|uniref:Uncharacterized protein n=1 Tax=Choristoneura fumiferana TaxID=7141 RepID=A0ACC0KXI9_CHOFU|nr:hypothetical protein MSG28_009428 [Choristoneura fumiferana]